MTTITLATFKRKEVLLSICLVVVTIAFLYLQVYAPTAAEIVAIEVALGSQGIQAETAGADSRALEHIRDEVAQLEREIKLQARRLPDEERFEEVVSYIYAIGDQAGINVERLTLSGARIRDADYISIPLQVDFTGPYTGLVEFLTRLENARLRIFVVDNILVTTDIPGSPVLRGRIDIRTYYRGDHDRDAAL